jgi:hypothetical protein
MLIVEAGMVPIEQTNISYSITHVMMKHHYDKIISIVKR